MNTSELQHYCSQLPGAEHQLVGPPGNVLVYGVGNRQFAYFKLSDPEKWRFSIRTTPERFLELTDMPGIKPARYLGRFHWVTIVDVRSMPPDYLQELVRWSYNKALAALSKTRQAQLLRPSA